MARASGGTGWYLSFALLACIVVTACGQPGGQDAVESAFFFSKCPPGQTFRNGVCVCSPGFTQCGARCQNLQRDPTSCGRCGNVCNKRLGQTCLAGRCTSVRCGPRPGFIQCPTVPGSTLLPRTCYNSQTDPNHCGRCNNRCQQGSACVNGTCRAQAQGVQCGGLEFAGFVDQYQGVGEGSSFDASEVTNTLAIEFTSSTPSGSQSIVCGVTDNPTVAASWNASKCGGGVFQHGVGQVPVVTASY
jgi:hypothetical protein